MARPAKFTEDDLLDAALAAVSAYGREATIGDVTDVLRVPVGSIYYRFPTREHLMVGLWLRSVARFQRGILDRAARVGDAEAALERCARHVVTYCRAHPDEARALTLYRQQVLVRDCPAELRDRVAHVNDEVMTRMRELTTQRYGRATVRRLALVSLAVQQGPYGLVRPHLGGRVPALLEDAVVVSARAILSLGD